MVRTGAGSLGLPEACQSRYTRPETIVRQLSDDPRIRLVDASKDLTATETALLNAGYIEL